MQSRRWQTAPCCSEAFENVVLNIIITAGAVTNMTTNIGAERVRITHPQPLMPSTILLLPKTE